jgi:hypothetical protein
MTIDENLDTARITLNNAIELLKAAPERSAISDLIMACEVIDAQYKQMCEDTYQSGKDAYENGVSIEFYIEAEDWHEVSLALRKLRST